MNALLAQLMPAQPAASRAVGPIAAASPQAAAGALPTAAGLLAGAALAPQAAVLPLFGDALRAVTDEAQAPQELLETAAEALLAEPGMIAPGMQPATEPTLAALAQGFAAPVALPQGENAGSGRPAATLRIAGAVPLALAPAPQAAVAQTVQTNAAPAELRPTDPHIAVRPEAAAPAASGERPAPQSSAAATAHPVQAPVAGTVSTHATETVPLKLPNGTPEQWRQPLVQALGERLQVELGRGSERAVIRLDPPMMGSVEIVIRHEGGNLQVHLSASHAEVLRQLQSIGDSLRQDLANRQFGEVSVQVSDASRDADGRQRQRPGAEQENAPGRALAEAEAGHDPLAFTLASERE